MSTKSAIVRKETKFPLRILGDVRSSPIGSMRVSGLQNSSRSAISRADATLSWLIKVDLPFRIPTVVMNRAQKLIRMVIGRSSDRALSSRFCLSTTTI